MTRRIKLLLTYYLIAVVHGLPIMIGFLVGLVWHRMTQGVALARPYLDDVDARAEAALDETRKRGDTQ